MKGEITSLVRVYQADKKLKNTFMGMIGYRPTGFYSSALDETLIRKTFGISMEEMDLVHLFNTAEAIPDDDVKKDMQAFRESITVCDLPEGYILNHSRLTLAMK